MAQSSVSMAEGEWLQRVREQLDAGQYFLAYDLACDGLQDYADSLTLKLLAALALTRSGAVQEARKILGPFAHQMVTSKYLARRMLHTLRDLQPLISTDKADIEPTPQILEALVTLGHDLAQLGNEAFRDGYQQSEALTLLGEIHFKSWEYSGLAEDLQLSYDSYAESFRLSASPDCGINAAMLSSFLHHQERAHHLAQEVIRILHETESGNGDPLMTFKRLTVEAEAHLLLAQPEAAVDCYRRAIDIPELHYTHIVRKCLTTSSTSSILRVW
jgi:tetratricopeptide (TPR) repeat protein